MNSKRSWVIAIACCWVTFVIQGLIRCGGVVYVTLIDAYGISRAQASWPFTLRIAIWNLSGPVAGALSYRWSIRVITLTGVLLVTITNIICWFTSDINMITFLLGGLQGLGAGMTVTLVPVIINQYFLKYKSTGAGIACAGATIGSFALPPIVEYAIEKYGLQGSFLIMAGITLNGVLGAALMRPAEWQRNKSISVVKDQEYTINGSQDLIAFKQKSSYEIKKLLKDIPDSDQGEQRSKSVRFTCNKDGHQTAEDESISLIEHSTVPITLINSSILPAEDFSASTCDKNLNCHQTIHAIPQDSVENVAEASRYRVLEFSDSEPNYDPETNLRATVVKSFLKSCDPSPSISNLSGVISEPNENIFPMKRHSNFDSRLQKSEWAQVIVEPVKAAFQITKNPMFLIIATNYSVFFLSYMTYLIVIVDYSLDLGVNRIDSVFLVSVFSISDLCGRLGSGWITDSGIIQRKHLMMANMMTIGGLLIATSFTHTYLEITAVSVSCGLIVGINLILFYALLEEYLGIKNLPMAIGLMNFSIGVISLVTPLLTGYFRDTMGSYEHLFHFLGSLAIVCGLLWLFEPVYRRRNKKKQMLNDGQTC